MPTMHKLSISTTPTSNNPTELPPSPRRRGQRNINETVISACRGAQLILGILILSLSASLSTRWTALSTTCGPGPNTTDCSKTLQGAGGLKYCVFVGVWVLFDFGLWVVDAFVMKNGIPTIVLIFGGQFTGGFAMGGGCTLAALINGWKCEAGPDGSLRLCHQLYADIAFFFLMVLIAWTDVGCLWRLRRGAPRPDSRMS